MNERRSGFAITSLVFGVGSVCFSFMNIYAVGIPLIIVAVVLAIVSLAIRNYEKVCAIIALVFCAISLITLIIPSSGENVTDADYETQTYTITFDTNGGEAIPPMEVTSNTYLEPIVAYKDGYEFKNWSMNGTIFKFEGYVGTRITSDVTLKANYIKRESKGMNTNNFTGSSGSNSGSSNGSSNNSGSSSSNSNNGSSSNGNSSNNSATLGQKNALAKAKSYLSVSAFSRTGLIRQLEYEKFTNAEAIYGVDNCGANWNEQALKKAKSYLSVSAFSRTGLIRQLEYEGFTTSEAEYGVKAVGY